MENDSIKICITNARAASPFRPIDIDQKCGDGGGGEVGVGVLSARNVSLGAFVCAYRYVCAHRMT